MEKKHVGVFIEEDSGSVHKYVLVRTENSSSPGQVTVYHLDKDNTLRRLDGPMSHKWPKLFFNVSSCHCNLAKDDISPKLRDALSVGQVQIGGHHDAMGGMGSKMSGVDAGSMSGNNVMMHGGHDTAGMYNHMGSTMSGADAGFTPNNGVMMHGGHDSTGMYNRMDSKMSGNAMFMDMA